MVFILMHWSIGDGDDIVRLYADKDEAIEAAKAHAGPDYNVVRVDQLPSDYDKRLVFAMTHPEGYGGVRVESWEVQAAAGRTFKHPCDAPGNEHGPV